MTHIVTAHITSLGPLYYSNSYFPTIYIVTATLLYPMIYNVTAPITSLRPLYYSNYYVLIIYIVTATTTSQWFILSQQLLRHSDLHITTTFTSLCSILLQQLLHPYELYCYSNHYVPMINIVTAQYVTKTSYSSNYYLFMCYIVTATITTLYSKLSQQLQLLRP